jgi:hypothetical protein
MGLTLAQWAALAYLGCAGFFMAGAVLTVAASFR